MKIEDDSLGLPSTVSLPSLLRCFVDNIPAKFRQIIFRNVTLTEMSTVVPTYDESDLSWLDPLVKKAQDIWINLVDSGELTVTKTDLLSISVSEQTSSDGRIYCTQVRNQARHACARARRRDIILVQSLDCR